MTRENGDSDGNGEHDGESVLQIGGSATDSDDTPHDSTGVEEKETEHDSSESRERRIRQLEREMRELHATVESLQQENTRLKKQLKYAKQSLVRGEELDAPARSLGWIDATEEIDRATSSTEEVLEEQDLKIQRVVVRLRHGETPEEFASVYEAYAGAIWESFQTLDGIYNGQKEAFVLGTGDVRSALKVSSLVDVSSFDSRQAYRTMSKVEDLAEGVAEYHNPDYTKDHDKHSRKHQLVIHPDRAESEENAGGKDDE